MGLTHRECYFLPFHIMGKLYTIYMKGCEYNGYRNSNVYCSLIDEWFVHNINILL